MRKRTILAALSPLALLPLALSQLACSRSAPGELYVTLDSTDGLGAVEVLALPFDPAGIPEPAGAVPSSVRPETSIVAARSLALRDSALALDAEFQRERALLNREALSLRRDTARLSRAYAERYDAWARRVAAAERTRALRDRVRSRLAAERARLGPAAPPELADPAHRLLARATVDSAARTTGRSPVRAPLSAGGATLHLPPGRWWVTVGTRRGASAEVATRVDVRAGTRDTVRLSGV